VVEIWLDGAGVVPTGLCQPEERTLGLLVRAEGWQETFPFRIDRACRSGPLPTAVPPDAWLAEMRATCQGPFARADELVWACPGGEQVSPLDGTAPYFRVTKAPRPVRKGGAPSVVALRPDSARAVPETALRLTPGGGMPVLPAECPARGLPPGAKAGAPEGIPGVVEALEGLRWAVPAWRWEVVAFGGADLVPGSVADAADGSPAEVIVAVKQAKAAPGGWEDALTLLADVREGEVRLRYVDVRIRYRAEDTRVVPYTVRGQPYVRIDGWDEGDLYYCQSLHLRWDGVRMALMAFE
jgi:hypothetical protein